MSLLSILSKVKDWTPAYHALLAMAMQAIVAVTFFWSAGAVIIGAAFGVAYYWGREVAQAEKRWKDEWGQWYWWRGFDVSRWDKGSLLDAIYPTAACTLATVIYYGVRWL